MSNSVHNTPLRALLPAQRCILLAVIATFALGLPGTADARSKGRQTVGSAPAVATPAVPAKTVANAVTPASLRAANDSVGPKAMVEAPTGALRSAVTVGKTSIDKTSIDKTSIDKTSIGKISGATTADAVVDPLPTASPQRPKDWYPESHSYLRPYHYKWRYWTPG